MKYLATILCLSTMMNVSSAQISKGDSVDYYISHLDWNAATVATTYVPKVVLNDYAQKLVLIKGKSINNRLYEKIGDTEKTLAIHVILTQRHKYSVRFSEEGYRRNEDSITKYQMDHYTKDTLLGMVYKYNGLSWYYDLETGQSDIAAAEIKHIQQYWRKKLRKKKT